MREDHVRNAFLVRYLADLEAGKALSLEAYQASYPGHEDSIAEEFDRCAAEMQGATVPSDAGGSAPARSDESPSAEELLRQLASHRPIEPRYRIDQTIGRGGMGEILAAFDEDLRRSIAMKVLPEGGDASTTRFLYEAQITGQLDHPGVVPVHELGIDGEGRVFFTMRLVEGRTLEEVFEHVRTGSENWTRARAVEVIVRVCDTLAYAHSKGVVHRDLKPQNIMVGRFGEVYVMDWGIAKVLGQPEDERDLRIQEAGTKRRASERIVETPGTPLRTMDGMVIGTPCYMSPEQAHGRVGEMGPWSDVYAVGAILYELLSGSMPYVHTAERDRGHIPAQIVLERLREGPPEPIERLVRDDVPPELVAVCAKAMARESRDRYQDAGDLADELRAYLERRVVRAYATGPMAELRKWVARNRAVAWTATAALLVLAVTTIVFTINLAGERNRARTNETLAKDKAAEANRNLRDVLDLATLEGLRSLVHRADDELWPAHPDKIPAIRAWIAEAEGMPPLLESLAAKLAVMRSSALDRTPAEIEADRRIHPRFADLEKEQKNLHQAKRALRELRATHPAADASYYERVETRIADTTEAIAELEQIVAERVTYKFAADARLTATEKLWRHDLLARLVSELRRFVEGPSDPIDAQTMWGPTLPQVRRRLGFAEKIGDRTVDREEARRLWAKAKTAGVEIEPIVGLVPLSPDPKTGLWEFWHPQTGARPAPNPDYPDAATNRWIIDGGTGMVFVLLPGGSFAMGAQSKDPLLDGYDENASQDEAPIERVTLAPFLISKYEVAQSQWIRMTGRNPSLYPWGLTHPVEHVSWNASREFALRLGMNLPTEAQWEFAARAGSTTPWWTGAEPKSLATGANLADQSLKTHGGPPGWKYLPWEDGFGLHAPLGSLRANAFGLHDVIGNVWEYCLDAFPEYGQVTPREGDGLREVAFPITRVTRGGAWDCPPSNARSSGRYSLAPDFFDGRTGLRPVIRVR